MPQERLESIEVTTAEPVERSIIWLHGLGADGHDFEGLVPELDLGDLPGLRFVFPHAPVRPVTINGGFPMRAWYDIAGLTIDDRQDEGGIRESQRAVLELIGREADRGIEPAHVVLAGFSQGGAIALHTGLRHDARLAGILALSSYLPLADTLDAEQHPGGSSSPIFMGHGEFDDVVPLRLGELSRQRLEAGGCRIDFRHYPMAHSLCPQEVVDISAWLRQTLA